MSSTTTGMDAARQRLEEMRASLERDVEAVRQRIEPALRDVNLPEPHDAVDSAAHEMVLSEEDALADGERRRLESVEAALRRIEDGTYGRCSVCERPIAPERLEARPDASTCVEHATAAA